MDSYYNYSFILTEIDLVFGLLIRKEQPPVFLQLRILVILIEHGKYISLNRLSRLLRSAIFHMLNQICVVSPCIFHSGCSTTDRRPTSLRYNNLHWRTTCPLKSRIESINNGVEKVLIATLTVLHHNWWGCKQGILKTDITGQYNWSKGRHLQAVVIDCWQGRWWLGLKMTAHHLWRPLRTEDKGCRGVMCRPPSTPWFGFVGRQTQLQCWCFAWQGAQRKHICHRVLFRYRRWYT